MIAVKLWGGIGNQMFQYAFGLYLAEKRNNSSSYFTEGISKNLDDFEINNFNLNLIEFSEADRKNIGYSFKSTLEYRLKRKFIQLFPFLNKKVLVENGLQFKENISENSVIFDGYWQCFKYVNAIEGELREKFIFKDRSLLELNDYAGIVFSNSVSLHIRKGDYLLGKNALIYEACPIEYYINGIELISKNIESPVFYVFSNDLVWAKENLKVAKNINLQFVDNSYHRDSAIADLFLMSKCKHNIIANSTFSWWGAWLNSYENKMIIAPEKWYVGDLNKVTEDLIPSHWTRM